MPITVENYTNNRDILEFAKNYGAKDLLECLNLSKWEEYFLLLEKNNDDNHLNLIFKENNEILGLVAINILNETGIVYSIVLKSKELFSKLILLLKIRLKN